MANRLAPPDRVDLQSLSDLSKAVDSANILPKFGPTTDANVTVEAGQFRHLAPRSAGQNVVIPAASAANFNKRITLYVDGALGTCRVRPVSGKIDNATSFTLRAGYTSLIELVSNGTSGWATTRASGYPTAGNALSFDGDTLDYTGSTSTINTTPTTGDLNVVDISTLECGGVYTFQSVTEATIDGFTAKTDGFWFILHNRDATTSDHITLLENSGNTTTSIRTPNVRGWRLTKNDAVMLIYSNTRWRTVACNPKNWVTPVNSVTWAAQQDNYQRVNNETGALSAYGVAGIRVTLTGNQLLTGIVPDLVEGNGELLYIDMIDSVDSLTIAHDSTSTAANRFFLPDSVNFVLGPRQGALFRYDGTTSRWRLVATSAQMQKALLTQTSAQTQTNSVTNVTSGTYTIPLGSLSVGSEFWFDATIHTSRGATATAANVIIELLVAGAVVRTLTLATTTTSGHLGWAEIRGRLTCRTTGASGTSMVTMRVLETITNADTTPNGNAVLVWNDPLPAATAAAATTVDTTIDNTVQIRARFSAAVANLAIHMYDNTVTRVR